MRNFLSNQVNLKKQLMENEKVQQKEQIKLWNDENQRYFTKEKETKDKVALLFTIQLKETNKSHAEFLKSQMDYKKTQAKFDDMNEEEYRMNKELLGDFSQTPMTKKNFLI